MAKKVFIRTYGCQMNEYDSARMLDALREGQAMEPTDRPEDADLILLNTCSIREKAQEKVLTDFIKERNAPVKSGGGGGGGGTPDTLAVVAAGTTLWHIRITF